MEKENKLSELDINMITLNYMQEDYGHLVDLAIDKIIETVSTLLENNLYDMALNLSKVFESEDFWEGKKEWALKNYYFVE